MQKVSQEKSLQIKYSNKNFKPILMVQTIRCRRDLRFKDLDLKYNSSLTLNFFVSLLCILFNGCSKYSLILTDFYLYRVFARNFGTSA